MKFSRFGKRRIAAFVASLAILTAGMPGRVRAELLGVEYFNGRLVRINDATGAGTVIGSTGYFDLNSLAASAAGTLYSVGAPTGGIDNTLITINPVTGVASPAATITLPGSREISIRAMAFSPTGVLYAVNTQQRQGIPFIPELFTINPTTGAGTLVGSLGTYGVQGLDFSPSGVLYGYALDAQVGGAGVGLVTIDPTNAAVTDVNPAVPGTINGQSIAFAPDCTLYAGGGIINRVDPATGVETLVGTNGFDIRGLEFVPEPTGGAVLSTLSVLALARRKNRLSRCSSGRFCSGLR